MKRWRYMLYGCILFLIFMALPITGIETPADSIIWLKEQSYDEIYPFYGNRAMVRRGTKIGYIDRTGKEVIPCKYDAIPYNKSTGIAGFFQEDKAIVKQAGKYGMIDSNGKILVPIQYISIGTSILEYWNEIPVLYSGKKTPFPVEKKVNQTHYWGYMDKNGKLIANFKYTEAAVFQEERAVVQINRKYGYINTGGKEVIPLTYEDAHDFSEGFAAIKRNGKWGYIDKNGNTVVECIYDGAENFAEGRAAVCKNDKWGYLDAGGKIILPLEYDKYYGSYAKTGWGSFQDGMVTVTLNLKYGVRDRNGKEITPLQYNDVGMFTEGLAWVCKDGKYGYIDKTGTEVISCIYSSVSDFSNGYALVSRNGSWFYITSSGSMLPTKKYDEKESFSEGFAVIRSGKQYGYLSVSGKEYLACKYEKTFPVKNGMMVIKDSNRFGLIGVSSLNRTQSTRVLTAIPNQSAIFVNNKRVEMSAYTIEGNNYFKLRDIAAALNGTTKNFEIKWDAQRNTILLSSNTPYTLSGGELTSPLEKEAYVPSQVTPEIYKDGNAISLNAYNIGGNNYFKLRDMGELFDFGVDWDEETQSIFINTKVSYSAHT